MLFMRPVLVTTKLPALDVDGDFNFFDFSKYVIGDGGPPEIAASDDYLFRTNERAFRIVHRVAGAPWLNTYVTLEDATTKNSPFVSLKIQ
jgi:HK97 family phage major capsid protein